MTMTETDILEDVELEEESEEDIDLEDLAEWFDCCRRNNEPVSDEVRQMFEAHGMYLDDDKWFDERDTGHDSWGEDNALARFYGFD